MKTPDGSQSSSLLPQTILETNRTTGAQMSRELRSENRRNLLALGDVEFADHFKFSQLKVHSLHPLDFLLFQCLFSVEKKTSSVRQIQYTCLGSLRL